MAEPAELLRRYDAEVRATAATRVPAGWESSTDGPLLRAVGARSGHAMLTVPAHDLPADEVADLVERTVRWFTGHGRWFEWKTYDHDRADLPGLLLAAGAAAEDHETLVLGEAARLVDGPADVPVREVATRADMDRVAGLQTEVWGEDWSWLAEELDLSVAAGLLRVFVVEMDGRVVSAAWLEPFAGTGFAGLWGGSTLTAYRGRGIYRALVAARARVALDLGHPVLQVDASEDSRPILERLGLQVVGGTRPYVVGRAATTLPA